MRRTDVPLPPNTTKPARRQSTRGGAAAITTDPNANPDILDGVTAVRASPDGHEYGGPGSLLKPPTTNGVRAASDATTEKMPTMDTNGDMVSSIAPKANGAASATKASKSKPKKAGAQHVKVEDEESNIGAVNGVNENVTGPAVVLDGPADLETAVGLDAENEDEAEVKEALSRPPPVNSEYLPLPWKGRLGYVCPLQSFVV